MGPKGFGCGADVPGRRRAGTCRRIPPARCSPTRAAHGLSTMHGVTPCMAVPPCHDREWSQRGCKGHPHCRHLGDTLKTGVCTAQPPRYVAHTNAWPRGITPASVPTLASDHMPKQHLNLPKSSFWGHRELMRNRDRVRDSGSHSMGQGICPPAYVVHGLYPTCSGALAEPPVHLLPSSSPAPSPCSAVKQLSSAHPGQGPSQDPPKHQPPPPAPA